MRSILFVATALLFVGCAGGLPANTRVASESSAPLIAPSGTTRSAGHTRSSWLKSDAKRNSLLYVTNANDGTVNIYSYPNGALVGELGGFEEPYGLCAEKAGNIWIVDDEASSITEFAHGGTDPIRVLSDPGEYPAGCSIDPTTGNLAVTNYETTGAGQGGISIYRKAKGKPKNYTDSSISRGWFCSYDDNGNLFVDGNQSGSKYFQLAELLKGHASFTNIHVDQSITVPGGVQWDGAYVAVADENGPGNGVIYQFSISGSTATEVTATTPDESQNIHQFWIDPARNRVVVPSASLGTVGYWKFPAGGNPTKTISGLNIPEGVALSR